MLIEFRVGQNEKNKIRVPTGKMLFNSFNYPCAVEGIGKKSGYNTKPFTGVHMFAEDENNTKKCFNGINFKYNPFACNVQE